MNLRNKNILLTGGSLGIGKETAKYLTDRVSTLKKKLLKSKLNKIKNGDIVFIGKSSFNVASEVLNEVTSPLQSLVSIYGIYKVFD